MTLAFVEFDDGSRVLYVVHKWGKKSDLDCVQGFLRAVGQKARIIQTFSSPLPILNELEHVYDLCLRDEVVHRVRKKPPKRGRPTRKDHS